MRRTAISLAVMLAIAVGGTSIAWAGTYSGYWKGQTGQKKTIKFHVTAKNKINTATITYKIPFSNCDGSATITSHGEFKPPVAIVDAKFTLNMGSTNNSVTIKGHFETASKAAGKATAHFKDTFSGCEGTKTVYWHAHKT